MGPSEIKVEVFHKDTIKPSSPTPHHLQTSNLSVFDQVSPEIYVPILLFYPGNSSSEVSDHHSLVAERSKLLKTSLSEALTHFYPFAGKFQYNVSVSCNDNGTAFIEAKVNCPISKVFDKPDLEMLKKLIPAHTASTQAVTGYILLVQANFFECGEMAVGVSILHKVADATTLTTFINTWAAIASASIDVVLPAAEFGAAASLFPPEDFFYSSQPVAEMNLKENCTTRRFVFDSSKIAALKSKAASATVPNPTRVEVVSALIWKCAMEASRANLGFIKPSVWVQVVNMRKRSGQLLTENLLGNLVWYFASNSFGESEVNVQSFVAKFRKSIEEFKVNYANGVSGDDIFQTIKESGNLMMNDEIDNYSCSSWCRFPFYGVDFGWGKPSWVSVPSVEFKNAILLMDSRDGEGIEASLTLKEADMTIVETNKELLAYASLNPTVI